MNKIPKEEEKKADNLEKSNINNKEKPKKTVKVKKNKEKATKPKKSKFKTVPRKPPSAYFLFCSDKRAENNEKKFSAKELGKLFTELPDKEKENYKKKAQELMKAYNMDMSSIKEKSDEEEDKKETKTSKADMKKNSKKVCNCGKCDICKKNNKKNVKSNGSDEDED